MGFLSHSNQIFFVPATRYRRPFVGQSGELQYLVLACRALATMAMPFYTSIYKCGIFCFKYNTISQINKNYKNSITYEDGQKL
jgi:hypothetical protein